MATNTFETRNLSLRINRKTIFSDISLRIPQGKITAIIGPSGCGKSSFINCLNGLIYRQGKVQTEGDIYWQSSNLTSFRGNYKAFRRQVGTLFQNPTPFPTTIRKNLMIPIKEHFSMSHQQAQKLIRDCLISVGLWDEIKDRLDQSALKLSGGQKQRLCLARALLLNPNTLLMDEPCSALDPMSSAAVENLIRKLQPHITTIIVTHNIQQAKRIADYIVLFWYDEERGGYIIEKGLAKAIFAQPTQEITRRYLQGALG